MCIGRRRQMGNLWKLRASPRQQIYEGYKKSQTEPVRYTGDLIYSWQYFRGLSTTGWMKRLLGCQGQGQR